MIGAKSIRKQQAFLRTMNKIFFALFQADSLRKLSLRYYVHIVPIIKLHTFTMLFFMNLFLLSTFQFVVHLRNQEVKSKRQNFNYARYANVFQGDDVLPNRESKTDAAIIANQGKTANFMLAWPSITTFTLVKGWDKESTIQMKQAVEQVLLRNPILTGRAKANISGFLNVEISISPGAHASHDFVREIDFRKDETNTEDANIITDSNLHEMDAVEVLHFMDTFLAPIVPKSENVLSLAMNGGPLFGIDVIQLTDEYACYAVSMAHCVGDGNTYYQIMEEINDALNNQMKNSKDLLIWSHPEIASHEIFPAQFSRNDIERAYGGPFFLGLLKNSINMEKQKKSYIIIDKKKIENMRKSLSEGSNGNGHLSHNDVITAAICQANLSSDIFAFTMNMRERNCHFGGNFHNEIPFSKKSIEDPFAFRSIIKNVFFYKRDELPTCPFILGQVGRISSLATVQKLIKTDKMEVICHSMLSSFVQNVPLDTAFIISMNEAKYVILHNFREIDLERGLLHDLLWRPS